MELALLRNRGPGLVLSFHCFTKYIKVTFLNGASLRPVPPVDSKHEHVRYFHIHEDDEVITYGIHDPPGPRPGTRGRHPGTLGA